MECKRLPYENLARVIAQRVAEHHPKPAAIATRNFKLWLLQQTPTLPENSTITQRVYHLFNAQLPGCKMCREAVSWRKDRHAYSVYCSSKCAHADASVIAATKATVLQRYGVEHVSQSDSAKTNRVRTNMERYGVANTFWANRDPQQVSITSFNQRNTNATNDTVPTLIEQGLTQHQIGQRLGITQERVCNLLKRRGLKTKTPSKTSTVQQEVCAFITSLGIQVDQNVRLIPPHDVDLFIPSHNLAIEINGVFWHGELAGKDRKYHLNKTLSCQLQGVRLLHIFDAEWINKQEIVQSRLRHVLKQTTNVVYARKCTIRQMSARGANVFVQDNHVQGKCQATIAFGLWHEDQLVSVMTFGRSRYARGIQYELLRFCSRLNVSVVGGAARLFAAFVHTYNPSSIVSYSDRRWNSGQVYQTLGFTFDHVSAPSYHYYKRTGDTTQIMSRVTFQKHKLANLLPSYDDQATEWENMVANGYDRVWDCGNTVWIWERPQP